MGQVRRSAAAALFLFVSPGLHAQSDCTTLGQTAYVRDVLRDIYYWYRELPALDPALYDSPAAYLDAVRYRPLDQSFSYVDSRQSSNAFFSDSQFIGFGFGTRLVASDELRLTQVFPGGPAADAGLARGDRIVSIDGRGIAELSQSGALGGAFGASEVGVSVALRVRGGDGRERDLTLVKRLVTIPTVSDTRVIDADGRRVGYIHFRNFVQPSIAALDTAFAELGAQGVTELVLDLRYNGGGLISVAQHLAGLVGGVRTNNQLFCEFFHNDKNGFRNQRLFFADPAQALDLQRLVVITTRSSASASELIINALRPFLPVTVVGDTTFGKPVGQYGFEFCDKVLFPVSFTLRNAKGEGDFFGGFPADCPAADDLDRQLGDAAEASLAEALHYVRTGACGAAPRGLRAVSARATLDRPRDGRQVLIGAW
jgi:C-terminal peptidase prc